MGPSHSRRSQILDCSWCLYTKGLESAAMTLKPIHKNTADTASLSFQDQARVHAHTHRIAKFALTTHKDTPTPTPTHTYNTHFTLQHTTEMPTYLLQEFLTRSSLVNTSTMGTVGAALRNISKNALSSGVVLDLMSHRKNMPWIPDGSRGSSPSTPI